MACNTSSDTRRKRTGRFTGRCSSALRTPSGYTNSHDHWRAITTTGPSSAAGSLAAAVAGERVAAATPTFGDGPVEDLDLEAFEAWAALVWDNGEDCEDGTEADAGNPATPSTPTSCRASAAPATRTLPPRLASWPFTRIA